MNITDLHYRPRRASRDTVHIPELTLDTRPTLLLGVNGAGKTTLLKLVAGQLRPRTGSISTDEAVVYLPQHFRPIAGFTCAEYAEYVAWLWGASRRHARTDSAHWLDFVGLRELASQRCDQLSGGQQARLALAAALGSPAHRLLLDEPSAALDPVARRQLTQLYHGVVEQGRALVVSSHNSADFGPPFQRILVLDSGTICFDGTPQGFLAQRSTPGIVGELARSLNPRNEGGTHD